MSSIYYFCRGNGFGHASRALDIRANLSAAALDVTMFSGTSATEHFARTNIPTTDLGWTDATDHGAAAVRTVTDILTRAQRVDLVIADELHYVPLICANLAVPSILLSCRLGAEAGGPEFDIACAQAGCTFIIPDWRDCHDVPDHLADVAEFPGPLVQTIHKTKRQARAELGVPERAFLCVLAFGSIHPAKSDLQADLLRAALVLWQDPDNSPGELAILCGRREAADLIGDVPTPPGVRWIGFTADAPTFYRASDVVMCTAGTTALELAKNRIPCVVFPGAADDVAQRRSAKLHDVGLAHVATLSVHNGPSTLRDDLRAAQLLTPSSDAEFVEWCEADLLRGLVMTALKNGAIDGG